MSTEKIVRYFKDGARIASLMKPWLRDKIETENNISQICYFVDSDIVTFFTDFYSMRKYARVFYDENWASCLLLARNLANHIFFKLDSHFNRIMIMPPHDIEVANMYTKVETMALKGGNLHLSQLATYEQEIHGLFNNIDRDNYWNEKESFWLSVVNLFLGDTRYPIIELSRYGHLLKNQRICIFGNTVPSLSAEQLKNYGKLINEYKKHVRQPEYISSSEEWFRLLHKDLEGAKNYGRRNKEGKTQEKKGINIERDAQVLTGLTFLNNYFIVKGVKLKFVFITGSENIHSASRGHLISDYIRHPIGLLNEVVNFGDLDDYDSGKNGKFEKWLRVFLGSISPDLKDEKTFYEICQQIVDEKYNFDKGSIDENKISKLFDIKKQWDEYIKAMVIKYWRDEVVLSDDYKRDPQYGRIPSLKIIRTRALQILKETIDSKNGLGEEKFAWLIKNKEIETWENFFAASTTLAYPFVALASKEMPARCVPAIKFRDVDMQTIADKLLEKREIRDIYTSLEGVRNKLIGHPYYFCTCFSLLYCYRNRWDLAEVMAKRGIGIADQLKESKENNKINGVVDTIYGNEAAYILAVCKRINSKHSSDLQGVEDLLNDALQRSKVNKYDEKLMAVRVECQKSALWITYYLYNTYCGDKFPQKDIPSPLAIGDNILESIKKLDDLSEKNIARINKRRMLANLSSICYLIRYRYASIYKNNEYNKFVDKFDEKKYLAQFDGAVTLERGDPWLSFRVKSLHLLAKYLWGTVKRDDREYKENVLAHFNEEMIKKNSILPYDQERYRDMKKTIMKVFDKG